jgi:hypothetical protein
MKKPTPSRQTKKQPAPKKPTTANSGRAAIRSKFTQPPLGQVSKTAACLELLRQSGGTSLQELMAATGWQAHSVRGFLSGTVKKKLGLILIAANDDEGVRRYQIEAGA